MKPLNSDTPEAAAESGVQRSLGRFKLLSLVGKSRRSMAWRVADPHFDKEQILVLPRVQPPDEAALQRWQQGARRAGRLQHPNIAAIVETGVCERWPYVLHDPGRAVPLSEALRGQAMPGVDAAILIGGLLQGLAFAHDGAVAHGDVQPFLLLVGEALAPQMMGFEVGLSVHTAESSAAAVVAAPVNAVDALALNAQRQAARDDVLAAGLLLHRVLGGASALVEDDIGQVIDRLPPRGRDLVRLPWATPLPVAEALRAIANRSTDRQPRQRYGSARTLLRALDGWRASDSAVGGGPLALLLERLHSVGSLPASPGSAERAARLALMERGRTNELAEVVMQDLALSFELLRWVNSAQVRSTQAAGNGPVLTIRRSIAMLGLDGVRRAALGLRPWPGPLSESAAADLRALFDAVRHAGLLAQALRPAGYDAEVVNLLAMLQSLGRLITTYHFPDEVQQIRRLMQPGAEPATEPGMSEQAASFAVLGADIEAIGNAVARHWGLDDSVLHLMRRLPLGVPPRAADNDADVLRAVSSCANELVDALALAPQQRNAAVERVAQRYARVLNITLRDVQDILKHPHGNPVAPTHSAAQRVGEEGEPEPAPLPQHASAVQD